MSCRLLGIALLLGAIAAAPARAAGPPLTGGEYKVIYRATLPRGGEFRVEMDAGTDAITYLWLDAKRITKCGSGAKRSWYRQTGLVNSPFHVGADRHVVKTVRGAYKGDRERYDLRFDAGWTKVTLNFSTRFHHNYLGSCSGKARIVAAHKPPAGTWQLGAYAGTTGQGLPLTFTAGAASTRAGAWTYTDFLVSGLRTSVAFTCTDGFTATRDLTLDLTDETRPGTTVTERAFFATLTPGGVAQRKLSGPEQLYAQISGSLSGTQATGTLTPDGMHVSADGEESSCRGAEVPFSAARPGG